MGEGSSALSFSWRAVEGGVRASSGLRQQGSHHPAAYLHTACFLSSLDPLALGKYSQAMYLHPHCFEPQILLDYYSCIMIA